MKLLFRPDCPSMDRVLLVESGSRQIAEKFLAHIYAVHSVERVDVLTCYAGEPRNFDDLRGQVISVHSVHGVGGRASFINRLARSGYNVVAILCSNEAIMTPWKWAVGARVPAKLLVVNENGDYFWLDTGHLDNLRALIKHRWGMQSGISLQLTLETLVSPLIYLYLLAYAGWVHARRALRRG